MVLLDHGGRHSSEVELWAPPSDLAHLVDHLWIQGTRGTAAWRVVADTSPYLLALVTDIAGARRIRVQVVGARTHAATVNISNRALTVGVRLRAGVLPSLTGQSARELVDRTVPVDSVLAPGMLSDLELGHDAPPDVIARELIRLLRRASIPRVVRPLIPDARIATVRELATWLRMAPRSLRDVMYRETGLGPKHMLRVLRLHAALHAARRPACSWSDVAYIAGYADQAHLTREVRALLGETPSQWRTRGSADSFKTPPRH